MPERTLAALKVARLTLLVSILAYGLLLAAIAVSDGAYRVFVPLGLVAAGWLALSAAACLVLQALLFARLRRTLRRRP